MSGGGWGNRRGFGRFAGPRFPGGFGQAEGLEFVCCPAVSQGRGVGGGVVAFGGVELGAQVGDGLAFGHEQPHALDAFVEKLAGAGLGGVGVNVVCHALKPSGKSRGGCTVVHNRNVGGASYTVSRANWGFPGGAGAPWVACTPPGAVVWSHRWGGVLRWAERKGWVGVSESEDELQSSTGAAGAPRSGRGGRRRRANAKGGRHHRHEVKVTPQEEARLLMVAQSQGVTVSRLLVESALAGERGETATERAGLITELFAVHRTWAGVANNVNQIAKKLHGTGELAAEMDVVLGEARAVMARVDALIDGLAL